MLFIEDVMSVLIIIEAVIWFDFTIKSVEEVFQNDLLVMKVTISGLETHIPSSNGAAVLI